jgi:ribose-phosphate pyrophosphokinase
MKVIAGTTHPQLAKNIALAFGAELIQEAARRFNDGELSVYIPNDMIECVVVIVQSTCNPADNNLFELLMLIDAAKKAEAKDIIAVIPYCGYGRSDSSLKLVARLLECAGADRIITIDLHSAKLKKFFRIPVINLSACDLFLPLIENSPQLVIVSPDQGGMARAKKFSDALKCELAVINKEREGPSLCHMTKIKGNVQNTHCAIIDDIVDSAGTLCKAADFLISRGAASVEVFVTHAVLSNRAIQKLENSYINCVHTTNTIIKDTIIPAKFNLIPIESLIIKALRDYLNGSHSNTQ